MAFFNYSATGHKRDLTMADIYESHYAHILSELRSPNPSIRRLYVEVAYILRRVPDHYQALNMYGRLYTKFPKFRLQIERDAVRHRNRPLTPECIFDRAFRFHPKNPKLRLLYGIFFHRMGKLGRALEQYKLAAKMSPNWAEAQYNIGLVYLGQKALDAAKIHAKKAYALGYPLPALRDKLKKLGAWP